MREDGLLTVGSLINILEKFDPERVVIIAKDAEGNDFSPLSEITMAAYLPQTTHWGTIGLEELTGDLEDLGYSEDDVVQKGGIPCIILEPVN